MTLEFRKIQLAGKTQSGKSTMMDRITRDQRRLVLLDPVAARAKTASAERLVEVNSIDELRDRIGEHYFSGFRYWLRPTYTRDGIEALHDVSNLMFEVQEWALSVLKEHYSADKAYDLRPDIALSVDEMATSYPNHQLPKNRDGFTALCNMGRHDNIQVIGASQRPNAVGIGFRAQCDTNIFFTLTQARDLAVVEEIVGSTRGAQVADVVRSLPKLHYVRWDGETLTKGKLSFPG